MTYKYYSFHRPIGIGTLPRDRKPVRIENYTEGMKEVTASDGRTFYAWGEVEYETPLSENEVYSYELKRDYEHPTFKHVGWWMDDGNSEIIRIEGKYYVLNGWNGEKYCNCWECLTKTKMADPDKEYTLTPVYKYETEVGQSIMNQLEDSGVEIDSEEWYDVVNELNEIVSYKVTEN